MGPHTKTSPMCLAREKVKLTTRGGGGGGEGEGGEGGGEGGEGGEVGGVGGVGGDETKMEVMVVWRWVPLMIPPLG